MNAIYSQFANDPDLGSIVVDYVERLLPERLAAVERSAADCDLETLQREVHRLKGSSACYGFAEVSECAGQIERACLEEEQFEELLRQTEALLQLCQRVVARPSRAE
ncbi:MAG: Hpt domain-containing protein [Lacipirellulaceae bacterium]